MVPGTHLHTGEGLPLEEHGSLAGQRELRAPAGTCVMLHGKFVASSDADECGRRKAPRVDIELRADVDAQVSV